MIPFIPRPGPVSNGEAIGLCVVVALVAVAILGVNAVPFVLDKLSSDWWVIHP